jgi:hypothetical protein
MGTFWSQIRSTIWIVFLVSSIALIPTESAAYVGPGAGLGLVGSIAAVLVALCVAAFGLIIFPIKLLRARKKRTTAEDNNTES